MELPRFQNFLELCELCAILPDIQGACRQVHRSEMIRKFMHLERSEYWEASDADWLYSAIYDVDVITNKALLGSKRWTW